MTRTVDNPEPSGPQPVEVTNGTGDGRFNAVEMFHIHGTYDWQLPDDIDPTTPILVHVWGAGGSGGRGSNNERGGGAGGLAVKRIPVSDLKDTTTITVGRGSADRNGQGGTSSFGNHCSATGGNSGGNSSDNEGNSSLGAGGLGLNGDRNRRGGTGGHNDDTYTGTSGASAPAPYGYTDGYDGTFQNANYGGAGGAGIGGYGAENQRSYCGGGGGGSAGHANQNYGSGEYCGTPGGPGILGAGGRAAFASTYQYRSSTPAGDGQGTAIIEPNRLIFGGGGGGGGAGYGYSAETEVPPGNGGPGAGGGGASQRSSGGSTSNAAGNGGMLGGGGGGGEYAYGGNGGNAGGGGGTANRSPSNTRGQTRMCGGDGLVIIQYRVAA